MKKTHENKKGLPFFGIGRMLPFLKKYSKTLLVMVLCGLAGTLVDIAVPLFQRYSLNHFVVRTDCRVASLLAMTGYV